MTTLDRLLDAVRRRAEGGDVLWRRSERTAIAFEAGRLKSAAVSEEAGVSVRVVDRGRVGVAGTTAVAAPVDDLLARALASAELGEPLELPFPAHLAVPDVPTRFDRAAALSLDRLTEIGRGLVDRLSREGCQIGVQIEREIGETAVANTAGAAGSYPSTAVVVSADLTRIAGNDVLMLGDQFVGADAPTDADLDAVVRNIETRLHLALTVVEPPDGALPVVFTPAGLSAVLLPLEQALSGKAVLQGISPLAGKVGERVFDPALAVTDDPLVPGRANSRPFDDEGIASARRPLIAGGVVREFVYDLETAARAKTHSTGHGARSIFGKPHIAYSNLVIEGTRGGSRSAGSGESDLGGGLAADVKDGLVVEDLIGVGQGNVIGGSFSHPVALAYRIRNGAITGRVKDAAIAGNVYDLLKRVGGFGNDNRWYGVRLAPSILLEGVSVARR